MNAFENMMDYYGRHEIGHWLWPHVEACSRYGLCLMSPGMVLMGRPVDVRVPIEVLDSLKDLSTGHRLKDLTSPHAGWHVLYSSGELSMIVTHIPYHLPWLLWARMMPGGGSKTVKLNTNDFVSKTC